MPQFLRHLPHDLATVVPSAAAGQSEEAEAALLALYGATRCASPPWL